MMHFNRTPRRCLTPACACGVVCLTKKKIAPFLRPSLGGNYYVNFKDHRSGESLAIDAQQGVPQSALTSGPIS